MKKFIIIKKFIKEKDIEVLTIHVKHHLSKDQWKNRYLLFNTETQTYKNERKKQNDKTNTTNN